MNDIKQFLDENFKRNSNDNHKAKVIITGDVDDADYVTKTTCYDINVDCEREDFIALMESFKENPNRILYCTNDEDKASDIAREFSEKYNLGFPYGRYGAALSIESVKIEFCGCQYELEYDYDLDDKEDYDEEE